MRYLKAAKDIWVFFNFLTTSSCLFPDRYLLYHFSGEGYSAVVTSSNRTLYKLLSLDSQLTPCQRLELLSQLELCLFSCQGFFLHREKRKDEVGQSGVLPFFADNSSFPVSFWDESSRTFKVQVKALLSIREAENQAQLGVESVLCAGGIHGYRPSLCRKGRGFDQHLKGADACFSNASMCCDL